MTRTDAALDELDRLGMTALVSTRCTAVTDEGVLVETASGEQRLLEADSVVLAPGYRSRFESVETLRRAAGDAEAHVIGDCHSVGRTGGAVIGGHRSALSIL